MLRVISIIAVILLALPVQASMKLRIITFNIMNQEAGNKYLPWTSRSTDMCIQLHKLRADILGLQDVDSLQLSDLQQGLPEYSVVQEKPSTGTQKKVTNPILFNSKVLRLVDRGTFWISSTPDTPSFNTEDSTVHTVCWAMFQDIKTGLSVLTANTCMENMTEKARESGALLIKTYLSKMTNKTPVILMGDFGTDAQNRFFGALQNRFFGMKECWENNKKKSSSASTLNYLSGEEGEPKVMDFIFVTPDFGIKSSSIISTKQGDHYLSDHNMLSVEVMLH